MKDKCYGCPRKTGNEDTPSPCAMERLSHQRATRGKFDPKTAPGCKWTITSKEHLYCFWNWVDDPRQVALSSKEVAQMLGISMKTEKAVFAKAIAKLQRIKNNPDIQALLEAVTTATSKGEQTPQSIEQATGTQSNFSIPYARGEDEEVEVHKGKDRYLPMHRSGKRVDLFGVYSKKALEKASKDKKK